MSYLNTTFSNLPLSRSLGPVRLHQPNIPQPHEVPQPVFEPLKPQVPEPSTTPVNPEQPAPEPKKAPKTPKPEPVPEPVPAEV